jgi:hypothetical protein
MSLSGTEQFSQGQTTLEQTDLELLRLRGEKLNFCSPEKEQCPYNLAQ